MQGHCAAEMMGRDWQGNQIGVSICYYTQLGPSCYYISLDHPFSYWLFQISLSLSVNLYQLSPLFIAYIPTYREDSTRRALIANQNYYRIYLGLLCCGGCLVIKSCSPLLQPDGLYIARQASLSMEFSRQGYWSGLLFPSPRDLPDPGMEPVSPAVAGRFFPTESPGKPTELL